MNRVLFFLLCIINSLYLNAQSRDFHFKYLSTADGLSNNSVIAIEQDKLGQIWLGTRNGLNKYNGDEFVVYRNNPKDTTSISNSDILTILEDTSGDIWVGTYKGLNRYDPKKNTFKTYYQLEGDENSLGNAVVICAQEMPNGELWFGTANGISIYNKEADNFINVFNAFAREGIQNFRNIQRIFLDSNNEVWVGTTKGLAKLESRLNSNFVFKEFESGIGNSSLFIQDIIEIEPGILGLATQHNGFVIFDTSTEEFNNTRYPEIPNNMDVRVLQKDDEDNLWLGTKNGVIIISPSRQVQHLKESKDSSSGISQNYIKSIFKDQNGSIWLGTYSGGANIWSETNENFVHFKNNNVFNNVVNAIVTDKASRVYFGTEGGIINKVDKNGTISEIIRVPDDETILSYPVQTMLYTEPDLLWVGVLNHGIYVYDLKTNKEATGVVSPALKTYLKNTGVFAIKEGVGGDFWFGTFGKGIVKYNVENKHITAISKPDISTNIIKALQLDDNGTIWAGGLGAINALRPDDAGGYDVTRYLTSNAFLSFNIKTIYKDSSDNIWVGTNAKGFYKFDGTDFKRVPISEESPISTVNTALEDERGVLWLSTDKGIVKYNPKYGESVVYEQTGVFSNNEFSPNSGLRLHSNQFYLEAIKV